MIDEKGLDKIYNMLKKCDSYAANFINKNDRIRIVRALELQQNALTTKREKRADWCKQMRCYIGKYKVKSNLFVLNCEPRERLYSRINDRVDAMMKDGLLQEVELLYQKGMGQTARQAIGYKEFFPLINGESVNCKEVVDAIKQNTRHYAKRQLTWFRQMKEANWISTEDSMKRIIEQLQIKSSY